MMMMDSLTQSSGRSTPLGAEDRVLLALHDVGYPRPITFVLTYPSAATAPAPQHLCDRIRLLIDNYPMLDVRLQGEGKTARWEQRNTSPSASPIADFFSQHTYSCAPGEDTARAVLMRAFRSIESADIRKAALWHVGWYSSSEGQEKVYITLAVDHTLTDGGGIVALLRLLMELEEPRGKELLGSTIGVNDALDFVVPEGDPPEESPLWPQDVRPASEVPDGFTFTKISVDVIPKLKEQAKSRGILGLNSILETAFLGCLWRAVGESDISLSTSTMRNERPDARASPKGKDVPLWSGNFFSGPTTTETLSSNTNFWQLVTSRSKLYHDPEEIAKGRSSLAPLFNMPMPLTDVLRGKAKSRHPFIASVFFSNITSMELPEGAEDFDWISSANPNLCAVLAHFVGTKSGLKLALSFRDGAGLTKDQASKVAALWEIIVIKVAQGFDGDFAQMVV